MPNTTYWGAREKTDDTRRKTEREAFAKLVESLAVTWDGVVDAYRTPAPSQ